MDLTERLARNLYKGYPEAKITPVKGRLPGSSVWHGLKWEDASEARRADFMDQAGHFLAGDTAKVINPALLSAYERTNGEPGNPEADVLLAEIQRRGLDV